MTFKRSHLFAAGILAVVVGYFAVSAVTGRGKHAEAAPAEKADPAPLVQVTAVPEIVRPYAVSVRGRTEAARSVDVKAETAGTVAATPVAEGAFVRAGQVLCRLDVDARQATLDQARAMFRSRQLQFEANQRLAAQGFRSDTQVAQAKADLDQAAAQVRVAEVALDQVHIRAPFAGVFDRREAEVGTYLSPGQTCGTVVELSPILVVGDVAEGEASRVRTGAAATARLASGQAIDGTIRFVSREAHPTTRTYRVEMIAKNPGEVRSGESAEIVLAAGSGPAHLVPVSAIVLDSAGRQGVRHVVSGRVAFAPVEVIEETGQGAWVSGLSGQTSVITVGQSFVDDGQPVRVAAR
jgi:multidrug efflux system membrane fusion protein